jgi:DNA repair exonuclease SbcCD ATPase subunit
MTRRERLEQKLEKRQEWAGKAEQRSDQLSNESHRMFSAIPFGQPILIGHHSEKRDRNYRNRAWNKMGKAVAQRDLAKHHVSKAGGLAAQLDTAIFSDDHDAIEAIEARIAEREAAREKMKLANKLYKKQDKAGLTAIGLDYDKLHAQLEKLGSYFGQAPHLPYEMSNLGANIRRDKQRIEQIKRLQARSSRAAASETGVIVEGTGDYVRVTFAEKPDRSVLNELKAAGFYWGAGSWSGKRDALPASVEALLLPESEVAQ